MNSKQVARWQRLLSETYYLLHHESQTLQPGKLVFRVSGSTKNVYHVTIYDRTRTIFCSCPDAKGWAKKQNCVCKHCLFVLYRVLSIFDTQSILTSPFFDRLEFTAEELSRIHLSYDLLQAHLDPGITNEVLNKKYQSLQEAGTPQPEKELTEEDACPICYESLLESPVADRVSCGVCRNVVHRGCLDKWLAMGNKICVYCRSQLVQQSGEYINVA